MMKTIALILALLLSSCSAQQHLRKAIRKDPRIIEKDTAVVIDTIVSPPITLTDTVTLSEVDTITLIKDRLKVKIVRTSDTIRVDATCESDTIISIVEVPYETIKYVEREKPMQVLQRYLLYFLSAIVGIKLLRFLAQKYL